MGEPLQAIVGLGNPGPQYDQTRHNAGSWFLRRVAEEYAASLRPEAKFHGLLGKASIDGRSVWLLEPTTYMNRSGEAVAALARYYKIAPAAILVAHDELDLPPGVARLKLGGGHGGHNGLRDIIARLGTRDFLRLRIGIGHPGHKDQVTAYVLSRPSPEDRIAIDQAIDRALAVLPQVVAGELQAAMNRLHGEQTR